MSSRFTDTVFLMVLALIGGMQGERAEKRGGEGNGVRVGGEKI